MRALHTTTTLLRSATLVGTLACACTTISLPCLGQEQVATVGQAGTLVWRGTKGPATPPPEDLSGYAELLKRELAAIQLAENVDGVGTNTEQRLRELWVRGALERDYPGRRDVLVELALVRMGRDARRGWVDSALEEGSTLLPHPGTDANLALYFAQFDLVEADAATLRMQQDALADARLVSLRAKLEADAQPVNAAAGAPAQSIEKAVREALAYGHHTLILELGARAAPTLEVRVREQPDELPTPVEADPLALLFAVSELRGAQVVLDLWDQGGFLFKKRVLRAMREIEVLSNPGTWSFDQMSNSMEVSIEAPRLAETIWLEVLTRLASDPEVARDSLDLVGRVARFDGLDDPLQRALISALDSDDPDRVNDVVKVLKGTQGRASVVPVLEHALDHALPQVRAFAAERLALYPRNDELRARADHPDLAVRRAVAASLVGKTGQAAYRKDGVAVWIADDDRFDLRRSIDQRDVACLTVLTQDAEPGIREFAVRALLQNPDLEVPSELLVRLAQDSSPEVRTQLGRWQAGKPADRSLLERLAADDDPHVLEALDKRLEDLARTTRDGRRLNSRTGMDSVEELLWSDVYLDALLIRIANPASEFGAKYAVLAAGSDATGATAVVRQAVSTGNREALSYLVWALDVSTRSQPRRDSGWQALPGEDLVAFVRAAWGLPPEFGAHKPLVDVLRSNWTDEALLPLRAVLQDGGAPADLRVLAAMLTASSADSEWNDWTLQALVSLETGNLARPGIVGDCLKALAEGLPSSESRVALVRGLVRTPDVPAWAFQRLSEELVRAGLVMLPPDLTLEILERLADHEWHAWRRLIYPCLNSVELTEEEPRLELMRRLLGNPVAARSIVHKLGRVHLDAHLPLLEEALLGPSPEEMDADFRKAVAGALASYLSDEAAEILLKGLGATTNPGLREAYFEALDTIRRYQDEKERWAQRKSSKQARDAAIAELVPMLADSDTNVRAQAARSLGALGAVEQLPALVRMLKDADANVRAAAQAAIEALTSSKDEG